MVGQRRAAWPKRDGEPGSHCGAKRAESLDRIVGRGRTPKALIVQSTGLRIEWAIVVSKRDTDCVLK
jgi:hypothetical protein